MSGEMPPQPLVSQLIANDLKVLLKKSRMELYLTDYGLSGEKGRALVFDSSTEAHQYCSEHDLKEMVVVYSFAQSEYDFELPIGNRMAPATPPTPGDNPTIEYLPR